MRKYSKFIVVGSAIAALAVPSAAMASQPANPGGFGQARAAYVQANGGAGAVASERKGDNSSINNAYKVAIGALPTESSLVATFAP
jgi:hypothetical protein